MNLTKEEITGLLKHDEGLHFECKLSRDAHNSKRVYEC